MQSQPPRAGKEPHSLRWLCAQCRLVLRELLLTRNTPSPDVANALHSDDAQVREKALDAIQGVDLRNRQLKGANYFRTLLPKSDLRQARLEGADLRKANLSWADLAFAFADLTGAKNLETAELAGADYLFALVIRHRSTIPSVLALFHLLPLLPTAGRAGQDELALGLAVLAARGRRVGDGDGSANRPESLRCIKAISEEFQPILLVLSSVFHVATTVT